MIIIIEKVITINSISLLIYKITSLKVIFIVISLKKIEVILKLFNFRRSMNFPDILWDCTKKYIEL